MASQHPSADQLDQYLINHLSDVDSADLERHVFACETCFSRVSSRDLEALALIKACSMLAKLESEGTQVLTVSTPEPDVRPAPLLPISTWRLQPHYAAFAATSLLAAVTFSSVGSVDLSSRSKAVNLVDVSPVVRAEVVELEPLDPDILFMDDLSPQTVTPKRRARQQKPAFVVQARYTRPFLPPNGDVEAPELDMNQVPPPVYAARRLDAPTALVRLPEPPKKRVRASRRVLRAIASPFKKIGGLFAMLAGGRTEMAQTRRAGI